MSGILDRFVTILGYEIDDAGLKNYTTSISNLASNVAKIGAAASGSIVGLLAGTAALTAEIAKTEALSAAVGIDSTTVEAIRGHVKGLGFDADHVTSLVEEMNNKLGESKGLKEITPVTESLKILGLQFKNIKDLKPEEQFAKISDAILGMKDQQKAIAAADILMGGEANRIFATLRNTGKKSMAEIIAEAQKLNLETEKSRAGAVAYASAWSTATGIVASFKNLVGGLAGEKLTLYVNAFKQWVIVNKELIQTSTAEFIAKVATAFSAIWRVIGSVITAFSNFSRAVGVSKGAILGIVFALGLIAKSPVMAFMIALALVIDDVMTYLEGGESVIGSVINYLTNMTTTTKLVTIAVSALALAVAFLFSPITAIIAVITAIVLAIMNWRAVLTWFMGIWDSFVNMLSGALDSIIIMFLNAGGSISEFFGGVVSEIAKVFSPITSIVKTALSVIYNAFVFYFQTIFTIVRSLLAVWSSVWNAIKPIVIPIIDFIVGFIYLAIQGIIATFNLIIGAVTVVFNAAKSFIASAMTSIVSIITAAFSAAKAFITSTINQVSAVIVSVFNSIVAFIRQAVQWIIAAIRSIIESVRAIFASVKTIATNAFTAIWSFIKTSAVSAFISVGNTTISMFTSLWTRLNALTGGFFTRMWTMLKSGFTTAINYLSSLFVNFFTVTVPNAAIAMVNSVIAKAKQLVASVAATLEGMIPSWVKNGVSGAVGVAKGFASKASSIGAGIRSKAGGALGSIGSFFGKTKKVAAGGRKVGGKTRASGASNRSSTTITNHNKTSIHTQVSESKIKRIVGSVNASNSRSRKSFNKSSVGIGG